MRKWIRTIAMLTMIVVVSDTHSAALKVDQYFDSYGELSWEEETFRLDNLARFLQLKRDFVGYIAFYTGKKDKSGRIKERVERAKDYLVCKRKIDEARIIIVDAGSKAETQTILHPVHKDAPTPDFRLDRAGRHRRSAVTTASGQLHDRPRLPASATGWSPLLILSIRR